MRHRQRRGQDRVHGLRQRRQFRPHLPHVLIIVFALPAAVTQGRDLPILRMIPF